jgi:hypothetical protein
MLSHPVTCRLLAAAAIIAFATSAWTAPAPEQPQIPTAIEKVRKELDRIVTVELTEQTLESAVNLIRQETKLNLSLDGVTLAQNNIDPSSISLTNATFRDVKARVALRSVLAPLNLNWVIVGDAIVITTEEMAVFRMMTQHVAVDLDQAELGTALKGLARDTGVSLVLDPRLAKERQTKVTLQADDITLESAVRILSELAGLKPVRMGNVLFITSRANAVELRAEADLAVMPRSTMQNADVAAGVGFGGIGRVVVPAVPAPVPPPAKP